MSSSDKIIDLLLHRQKVNIGLEPDDGQGDFLRTAFDKINIDVDKIFKLLSDLGLDSLPDGVTLVTSDEEKLNGYYALKNGSVDESFEANLLGAIQGLLLGESKDSKLFNSTDDLYGFYTGGLTSTYIVNYKNDNPNLALLLGNIDDAESNNILLGLNYFDKDSLVWKSSFSLLKSGRLIIQGKVLLDDNGHIPYERLKVLTGENPYEDLDTLEKLAHKIKNTPSTEVLNYTFNTAQMEWIIDHNKNHNYYTVQLFDLESNQIYAAVQKISNDSLKITFTTPVAGNCILTFKNVV